MIQAKRIYISRAEGLREECTVTHVCDTWREADVVLKWMARTAPHNGGYDKCDFVILYADGHTYEGRYDLTYDDLVTASLGTHVRDHVTFSSGERIPAHLVAKYGEKQAKERYNAFIADVVGPERAAEYRKFLKTYRTTDNG